MNRNQKQQGHGYFRKSKAYGLVCGIALAGTLMLSQGVKADEVVEVTPEVTITANPATNLLEAQPEASAANVSLASEAGTQTGELVSEVTSDKLDNAVSTATEAGVTVTTENKVVYDSLDNAQADLAKQETAVKEATAKQEANTEAIETAVAENKAIDKANSDEKARVDALNKKGEADTNAKNEEGQKAVDTENAKAKADADKENAKRQKDYDKAVADRESVIASNIEKEEKYKTEQTAYDSAKSEYDKAEKAYQDALKAKEQVEATNKTNQVEYEAKLAEYNEAKKVYDVAKSEYDEAVKAKEQAVEENTASQAEYKAKLAEYERQKAIYDKKKAEYDKAVATQGTSNEEYQRKLAEYELAKAEYDIQKAEYDRAVSEAQQNTTQDGYLSRVEAQSLTLDSEPNASLFVNGTGKFANRDYVEVEGEYSDWVSALYALHSDRYYESAHSSYANAWRVDGSQNGRNSTGVAMVAREGDYILATYTNLSNSYSHGVEIGKIEYRYDILEVPSESGLINLVIYDDPTVTIDTDTRNEIKSKELRIRVTPTFYDKYDNVLDLSKSSSLLSLSSINYDFYAGQVESVQNLNGLEFIQITGSSVVNNGGIISATSNNSWTEYQPYYNGVSPLHVHDWDVSDHPNEYFGAAVFKVTKKDFSFDLVNTTYSEDNDIKSPWKGYWQAINSKVKSKGVLTPPIAPTPPTPVEGDLPPRPEPPVKPTPPTGTVPNVPEAPKEPKAPTPPTPVDVPDVPNKPTPPVAPTPPTLEELPPMPNKPNFVTPIVKTFTPEVYVPVTPNVTPHVNVPEKELFKVSVHPVEIKQKPTNVKDVINENGVSINGMIVPKGHLVQWELSNSPLKAGREETTSYTLVDALPAGFELDEKASAEANPSWLIGKTEAGTTTLVATKATLDMLNADLTKDVAIPVFKAIGRPLNDGGTYENTFKTIIKTPKGEYTTTSNTPVIYTPGDDSRTYNGQVIVRYRTEEGDIEIRKNVIDTEDGKVGSDYDTTDNRPDTIAYEGKLYTRTPKVVGDETGKVVRGKIYVTYYYKEVPSTPDTGSVIVHYINEEGTPIKNDVVDTPEAPVGEDYDTTDNKPKRIITTDGIEYEIIPKRTIGNETGKVTGGVTEVTYVYKRITPKPPTPTPNDNLIQPKKDVVDNKGVSINGKVVLPNTPINYVLTQDFDQYEGMVASEKAIADGFIYIEDYQDDALDGKSMVVKSIKAKNGDDVSALYEMRHVLSKDELTGRLAEVVGKSGVVPKGEFYVWYAKDPAAFFKNYVQKGLSVTYDVTFKIKEGFTGKFTNQTHQIDFGNGYYGNIVENEVPELKVNKDIKKDGELVDKAEVALGETFDYVLNGYKVEANRGYDIESYAFVDLLTLSHDQVIKTDLKTSVDVTLSDGSVIKAGESIAKFGGVSFDEQTGRYEFSLSSDFLAKVPRESAFGADLIITVKRIKSGTVENKFDFYLNGIPVISDTVITETPEPPTPPTPEVPEEPKKPEPPTPPAPQVPEKPVLPKTGDAGSVLVLVGSVLSGLGIVGLKRKK